MWCPVRSEHYRRSAGQSCNAEMEVYDNASTGGAVLVTQYFHVFSSSPIFVIGIELASGAVMALASTSSMHILRSVPGRCTCQDDQLLKEHVIMALTVVYQQSPRNLALCQSRHASDSSPVKATIFYIPGENALSVTDTRLKKTVYLP